MRQIRWVDEKEFWSWSEDETEIGAGKKNRRTQFVKNILPATRVAICADNDF
jgi:hypothetical protein